MKKHLHRFLISAALCTATFQSVQAQCISTIPSSQQDKVAPALGNTVTYSDYSVELGNYSTYLLSGTPGQRYKFRSIYFYACCPQYSYESMNSYMTITDMKDSVLATGVPPLTIGTNKALKVKVHQFTGFGANGCGGVIASGGAMRYVLETVLCANSYKDADGDGFGNPDSVLLACPTIETGYVLIGNDCNDKDAKLKPTAKWFPDADGDGFGNGKATAVVSCTKPQLRTEGVDITTDSTDCDDTNPNVNPTAIESATDNLDANCDGADGYNNALSFDGVDDKVQAPLVDMTSNRLTIETWIKPNLSVSSHTIMVMLDNRNSPIYHMELSSGTLYFYYLTSARNSYFYAYTQDLINDGKWHHVAVVFDGTQGTLYADGVAIATTGTFYSNEFLDKKSASHYLSDYIFFKGELDDYRVWNIARTAAQLKEGMYSLSAKDSVGLKINYSFNQGQPNANNTSITSITDISGRNNNGTLKNFALSGTTSNFVTGAPQIFVPAIITGTQESVVASNQVSIYPNPSNGTFSITSTSELGNVSVYNSLGTMVYQNTTSAKQLNIELPSKEAGIYFVKVGNKMTKLIKE